jgi:hypothetical protein
MMCRDYDQVDVSFLCRVDNFFARHAVTELAVAVDLLLSLILLWKSLGFARSIWNN